MDILVNSRQQGNKKFMYEPHSSRNVATDKNHIFINSMLHFLGIKLDNIEISKKVTYFYGEYTINYMCDNQYLYLKVTSLGTIMKITITKLMYSINFIKDENIILVTFGTTYNMMYNPKICLDEDLYYVIITKIYEYYTHQYEDNMTFIGFKKVENILGLYCLENEEGKIYKYIEFEHKYNADTDIHKYIFGDEPRIPDDSCFFRAFGDDTKHMCMAAELIENINTSHIISTFKCHINQMYLNVEICDDKNVMSSYHIPLHESDIAYYIEKQHNFDGYNYGISIFGHTQESFDINEYFRVIKKVNDGGMQSYYNSEMINIYWEKISNTIRKMNNIIDNDIPVVLDILLNKSTSYDMFYKYISSDPKIQWAFGFLYEFILDDKLFFCIKIIENILSHRGKTYGLQNFVENYNKLFDDDVIINFENTFSFLIQHLDFHDKNYHNNYYNDLPYGEECVGYSHKINNMIKKIASYFIDFHENMYTRNVSDEMLKNIYNTMTSRKNNDLLEMYDSGKLDDIIEQIIKYRDEDTCSIKFDEDKYWLRNEREEYYDYSINHLYKLRQTSRKYNRKSLMINDNLIQCTRQINVGGSAAFDASQEYCVAYKYGEYIKYLIVEYGNGIFKSSSVKIEKTSGTSASISNETIENDMYEYMKISKEKTKNLLITKNLLKKNKHGINGFKAGITSTGEPCIIELRIFPKSVVAFDKKLDKYRTNTCSVKNIYKVAIKKDDNNAMGYKIEHSIPIHTTAPDGICPICCSNEATQVASPCRHNLCLECWMDILSSRHKKCPYCAKNIEKIDYIPNDNIMDIIDRYEKAYSFVSTHRIEYKIGETLEIKDFDPNINSVCKSGIHFHLNIEDTYKWFEYLLIPHNLGANIADIEKDNDDIYTCSTHLKILDDVIDNINDDIDNENSSDENLDYVCDVYEFMDFYSGDSYLHGTCDPINDETTEKNHIVDINGECEYEYECEHECEHECEYIHNEDEILLYNIKKPTRCDYEELIIEEE